MSSVSQTKCVHCDIFLSLDFLWRRYELLKSLDFFCFSLPPAPIKAYVYPAFFVCLRFHLWFSYFVAVNSCRVAKWAPLFAAPEVLLDMQIFLLPLTSLQVWKDSRLWWEVMMWKAVLEEVARARGVRDSCHAVTNASLCEWTLRDEEWVGVGEEDGVVCALGLG